MMSKDRGVPRILPGGMHIFGRPTPLPPRIRIRIRIRIKILSWIRIRFRKPDPHQNNADLQPWAQLSKDCCLTSNYV